MATMREEIVAQVGDLADGSMMAVKVGETDVLLTRLGDVYYAIGATCTHQGGPLAEGLLHGDTVMCPWHHACFRVTTGERMEPPALSPEPRYAVRVEGTSILVAVPDGDETPEVEAGQQAKAGTNADGRVFAILGGGAAGYAAADFLRYSGFGGRLVLITREQDLPYDRTLLSKDFLAGSVEVKDLPLRGESYYEDSGIEVLRGREVESVEPESHRVTFAGGEQMSYDALLLATGGEPLPLSVPGAELENVFYLRSQADAKRIVASAGSARRAVVVGAKFVGMETAASLTVRGLQVTVVAPEPVPFEKIFGREVGEMIRAHHEEKGVQFRLDHQVALIEGSGAVQAVVLDNGERIAADLVLIGIGVTPATGYLRGVPLQNDGSVLVDGTMRVREGLYAAGDIATFPQPSTGKPIRIEHWRVAEQQGRAAARALLGLDALYTEVPFFWTNQFDLSLCYVGHAGAWDDVFFWGDVAAKEFVAFYVEHGRITAAAGNFRDRDLLAIERLLWTGHMPPPEALRGHEQDLAALLATEVG